MKHRMKICIVIFILVIQIPIIIFGQNYQGTTEIIESVILNEKLNRIEVIKYKVLISVFNMEEEIKFEECMDIYGVVDGKIKFIKRIDATYETEEIIEEVKHYNRKRIFK